MVYLNEQKRPYLKRNIGLIFLSGLCQIATKKLGDERINAFVENIVQSSLVVDISDLKHLSEKSDGIL